VSGKIIPMFSEENIKNLRAAETVLELRRQNVRSSWNAIERLKARIRELGGEPGNEPEDGSTP
jgi:hypothetical protein